MLCLRRLHRKIQRRWSVGDWRRGGRSCCWWNREREGRSWERRRRMILHWGRKSDAVEGRNVWGKAGELKRRERKTRLIDRTIPQHQKEACSLLTFTGRVAAAAGSRWSADFIDRGDRIQWKRLSLGRNTHKPCSERRDPLDSQCRRMAIASHTVSHECAKSYQLQTANKSHWNGGRKRKSRRTYKIE